MEWVIAEQMHFYALTGWVTPEWLSLVKGIHSSGSNWSEFSSLKNFLVHTTTCNRNKKLTQLFINLSYFNSIPESVFISYTKVILKVESLFVCQLQPTGARQAFPCWDEPALRSTFDITLIVPEDRVALSNMVTLFWLIFIWLQC